MQLGEKGARVQHMLRGLWSDSLWWQKADAATPILSRCVRSLQSPNNLLQNGGYIMTQHNNAVCVSCRCRPNRLPNKVMKHSIIRTRLWRHDLEMFTPSGAAILFWQLHRMRKIKPTPFESNIKLPTLERLALSYDKIKNICCWRELARGPWHARDWKGQTARTLVFACLLPFIHKESCARVEFNVSSFLSFRNVWLILLN